jgi:hypothetical protein
MAGNPRAEWGKNCPKCSPTPPFKYPVATRPDNPAKRDPNYPAPTGYSTQGGGYSGLGSQKLIHSKFSKIEVIFFDKK